MPRKVNLTAGSADLWRTADHLRGPPPDRPSPGTNSFVVHGERCRRRVPTGRSDPMSLDPSVNVRLIVPRFKAQCLCCRRCSASGPTSSPSTRWHCWRECPRHSRPRGLCPLRVGPGPAPPSGGLFGRFVPQSFEAARAPGPFTPHLGDVAGVLTFPSGHAAAAALLCAWATWPSRPLRALFPLLNLLMAAAAVADEGHHLIDLFGRLGRGRGGAVAGRQARADGRPDRRPTDRAPWNLAAATRTRCAPIAPSPAATGRRRPTREPDRPEGGTRPPRTPHPRSPRASPA